MNKASKNELKLFVARVAMRSYEHLSRPEQIKLLKGLALVLPKREADAAEHTAWMLQKAEDHQLQFTALLGNGTLFGKDGQ